jgi:hypothetical protein
VEYRGKTDDRENVTENKYEKAYLSHNSNGVGHALGFALYGYMVRSPVVMWKHYKLGCAYVTMFPHVTDMRTERLNPRN